MLRRCINRNIVECKVVSVRLISFCSPRINRNIVECKEIQAGLPEVHQLLCINRNIVECKECCWIFQFAFAIWVLIETLWNVKLSRSAAFKLPYSVLIETLWNVKTQDVERRKSLSVVLIETLWNVKRSEFLAVLGDQKY